MVNHLESLGQIDVTRSVKNSMDESYLFKKFCYHCLAMHCQSKGVFSVYKYGPATKVYFLTKVDRSQTTVMFSDEY